MGYVKDLVFVPPLPPNLKEIKETLVAALSNLESDTLHRVWDESE